MAEKDSHERTEGSWNRILGTHCPATLRRKVKGTNPQGLLRWGLLETAMAERPSR